MAENKGVTIEQAKEQIAKLEGAYSAKMQELNQAEKSVAALKSECFAKLQELTLTQTQFYRGVIDIQNKQLADLNNQLTKASTPAKPVVTKKSARRDNVSTEQSDVVKK